MTRKLTETIVRRARVPANQRQLFLWDAVVTGFGLRILPGGSKIFWYYNAPLTPDFPQLHYSIPGMERLVSCHSPRKQPHMAVSG
jgi:hypothetical protein